MSDKFRVFVCTEGKKCPKRGGADVCRAFESAVSDQGVGDTVTVRGTKCLKLCKGAPGVAVMPTKDKYGPVGEGDAATIIKQLVNGQGPVEELLFENRKNMKKGKGKVKKDKKDKSEPRKDKSENDKSENDKSKRDKSKKDKSKKDKSKDRKKT